MSRFLEIARELGLDESMPKQASVGAYTDPVAREIQEFLNKEAQADREHPISAMIEHSDVDPRLQEFVKRAEVAGFSKEEISDFIMEKSAAGGFLDKAQAMLGLGGLGAVNKAMRAGTQTQAASNQSMNILNDISSNLGRLNQQFATPTWGERIGGLVKGVNPLQYGLAKQEQRLQEIMPLINMRSPSDRKIIATELFKTHRKPNWQNSALMEQMTPWTKTAPVVYPATAAGNVAKWWDNMKPADKKLLFAALGGGGVATAAML